MKLNKGVDRKHPYPIIHNGEIIGYLNENMITCRNLSTDNINALLRLHSDLYTIYEEMAITCDPRKLKELFACTTEIEYAQQELWGFPKDKNFHNWFKVPKCECPYLDSLDRQGTTYAYEYMNHDCPVHGVDESVVVLSPDAFELVRDLCNNPPEPNSTLERAMIIRRMILE